jgi:ubiquinone/menaquinone biosynthesis C-methylase UbiE
MGRRYADSVQCTAVQTDQRAFPADFAEMAAWVRSATPMGGRVLEIGCGDGALVEALTGSGIEAVGVDPHGEESKCVRAVPLEEFDAPPFDVVFASVSLHHLPEPAQTVSAMQRLTKPGTRLLVREFDRLLVDHEPTLRWWYYQRLAHQAARGEELSDSPFDEFVAGWREQMAHHVLPWPTVRDTLHEAGFSTESETTSAYLFRWGLSEPVRAIEEDLVARGSINQVGIRWTGRRK